MILKHFNRPNAKKSKQGCGCKMCKSHKGGWTHKFKIKDIAKMESGGRKHTIIINKKD